MSETESFTWLITGTSRGIGLEFVRQLVASPANTVFAACRKPDSADALKTLGESAKGNLHIVPLDLSDFPSVTAAAEVVQGILGDRGLDYLINSAAITNIAGPAFVSQIYLPLLEKGKRKVIMNLTSGIGSIGLDYGDKNASYCISKTGLNMLTYKQAKERPDLIAFVVDPGWVKTDMGGEGAVLEPHESIGGLLKLITNATPESSGKFFRYNGEVLPW
ncbi:hypothetical protein EWM64_g4172 [Hericium alpestre]|uniref:NAD(P)-binding protein n=1 Tax=Hericium alpestre TaxID=135208 RepID=A0A4Z0A0Y7_9AGAM|nr:hypothetical protein EWM64_g4172 [Hericium alpestre]